MNDPPNVLVFPGFGAGDLSTLFLRRYLKTQGFPTKPWRLGVNKGDVEALIPEVQKRTQEVVDEAKGQPVSIIGWSLGGVLAREVARDRPDLVRSVVTMGSPVVGGPRHTKAGPFYQNVLKKDLDEIERKIEERDQRLIRIPVSALYSRRDRVVQWWACIDRRNRRVRHIEVDASHLSLGFDPKVLRVVADEIRKPPIPASRA